ncbi:MAG TPA: acylphosphatase [Gammaproteobacteria bacterium]|nr:acylphosphatase [Gammaproteobacteria bacterium]
MQVCKRCLVSGRVQGVFYRASAAEEARRLGVTGYARNLADGRVEVLACGEADAVNELIDWLWGGPPAAKVQGVEANDVSDTQIPTTFSTK